MASDTPATTTGSEQAASGSQAGTASSSVVHPPPHTVVDPHPAYPLQHTHQSQSSHNQLQPDETLVYLANLPFQYDSSSLADAITECSQQSVNLSDVIIITRKGKEGERRSRGIAFAKVHNTQLAQLLSLNGHDLLGRTLEVQVAKVQQIGGERTLKRFDQPPAQVRGMGMVPQQQVPRIMIQQQQQYAQQMNFQQAQQQQMYQQAINMRKPRTFPMVPLPEQNMMQQQYQQYPMQAKQFPMVSPHHQHQMLMNDMIAMQHIQQQLQVQVQAQQQQFNQQHQQYPVHHPSLPMMKKPSTSKKLPLPRVESDETHQLMYINNLPFDTTTQDVIELFAAHGVPNATVELVTSRFGKFVSKSRGFGFCRVEHAYVDAALKIQGTMVGERAIGVQKAQRKQLQTDPSTPVHEEVKSASPDQSPVKQLQQPQETSPEVPVTVQPELAIADVTAPATPSACTSPSPVASQ